MATSTVEIKHSISLWFKHSINLWFKHSISLWFSTFFLLTFQTTIKEIYCNIDKKKVLHFIS